MTYTDKILMLYIHSLSKDGKFSYKYIISKISKKENKAYHLVSRLDYLIKEDIIEKRGSKYIPPSQKSLWGTTNYIRIKKFIRIGFYEIPNSSFSEFKDNIFHLDIVNLIENQKYFISNKTNPLFNEKGKITSLQKDFSKNKLKKFNRSKYYSNTDTYPIFLSVRYIARKLKMSAASASIYLANIAEHGLVKISHIIRRAKTYIDRRLHEFANEYLFNVDGKTFIHFGTLVQSKLLLNYDYSKDFNHYNNNLIYQNKKMNERNINEYHPSIVSIDAAICKSIIRTDDQKVGYWTPKDDWDAKNAISSNP